MKGLAIILMCALVAVQGRHASVKSTKALAALGDNPWLVHLRIAVSTSGLLETCAGSLIDSRWVLTSASCVETARFIWIRYGVVNVINPELVTETSAVRIPSTYDAETGADNIGLININRVVEFTANIAPVSPIGEDVPESAQWCIYGDNGADGPGEVLNCFDVALETQEDGSIVATSDDGEATQFDIGSPLVVDGVQIGVLVGASDDSSAGTFIPTARYIEWIEEETGLNLNPDAPDSPEDSDSSESSESSDSSESSEERMAVHVVDN